MTQQIWNEFTHGKQTYAEIARHHGRSTKWVQRTLQKAHISEKKEIQPSDVVIVMDTTYFKRSFGVMVFRCPHRKKNLLWKFVPYETIAHYRDGISDLEGQGWNIRAIVCDGRRGVLQSYPHIPVQMCHFHQIAIVQRYVTSRPKLEPGRGLLQIIRLLPFLDEEYFTYYLAQWHRVWKEFIQERTVNPETGRWHYTHRRIRSAYYSILRNIPYLFTYLRFPDLDIPHTSNGLEGCFTHVKKHLRLHSGLKLERKQHMIEEFLNSQ